MTIMPDEKRALDGRHIFDRMTIKPDDKDWTWVLDQRCDDCGFDTRSIGPAEVAALLRANALAWAHILGADEVELARRPSPDVWSPLEYACHVRDVFRKFGERLALMLTEDDPGFANWDQDAAAVRDGYDKQDPATVAAELRAAAQKLATGFDAVAGEQWQRRGHRSDGARFTVATLARYLAHDPIHHVHDVTGKRYGAQS